MYADTHGVTGADLRVERQLFASADGLHQLRFRTGLSYAEVSDAGVAGNALAVPVGATILFSLGRTVGVPLAFEIGNGMYFGGTRARQPRSNGDRLDPRFGSYTELALRAGITDQVWIRGGVSSGMTAGLVRPTLGIGLGF